VNDKLHLEHDIIDKKQEKNTEKKQKIYQNCHKIEIFCSVGFIFLVHVLSFFDRKSYINFYIYRDRVLLNAAFNIISVILWQSVLLVEETGGPRENQRPTCTWSDWQTLSHNVVHLTLIEYPEKTTDQP
jgi:hypothetical protein